MSNPRSWMGKVDLDPEPGDLIEISQGLYQHWAVYVGLDYVVHLAPPSESAGDGAASFKSVWTKLAEVKKERLPDVVRGDNCCISNKHDSKYPVRTPDQIVSMAEKLVGRTVKYDLKTHNCEHFSNFLRYDVARSDQVHKVPWLPMAATLAILLL